jgi:protein Mpv17
MHSSSPKKTAAELQLERTKRIDSIVWINGAILGSIFLSIVYQLFHVQVEALVALWTYGLGEMTEDMTKVGVAIDLLARLPLDLIHSYEALVPTNPIFYKACTSGVAYALGDFVSQIYQGRTLSDFDLPRSFRSGAAGFIGHGPLCHHWLNFMETHLDFNGAWWATGIKVTADLTIWAVFLNAAYSFIIGALAMRHPQQVWEDVKTTSWPALRSAWRFWPFVHTISFSHAVPLDLKLLWVDAMEVVWVTILSKVANEDKNAKLKVEPDLLEVEVQESMTLSPPLEIELTFAQELKRNDLEPNHAFQLSHIVLSSTWPLIVMWPVLYAGYQLEHLLDLVLWVR